MKQKFIVLVILIFIAALFFWWGRSAPSQPATSETPTQDSISDGLLTIPYSTETFGLAVKDEQVLVTGYIPPCDSGYLYCFYYVNTTYDDTNFEVAGVAVRVREDLTTERTCLDTPPDGYKAFPPPEKTGSYDEYSFAMLPNVGSGGAGHFTNGAHYRLYVRDPARCYEITTRIGQAQFSNYPEGEIKEFTQEMSESIRKEMEQLISSISLKGKANLFE